MNIDEVVGRELYEMFRESHDPGELPAWEDARDWDGWDQEYDDEYNPIDIDVHEWWISQGRRVNKVIAQWSQEQAEKEWYRKVHEHDNCVKGDECKASPWQCHCSLGTREGLLNGVPRAHTHK